MKKKAFLLAFVSVFLSTALSLCVVGLLSLRMVHASPYTNISVATAYNVITGGLYPDLVVLDVRTKGEYDGGHIYGAVWIPVSELAARINELAGHENHEIIVYCLSGGRSATASGILESHGFTKVYNMLGGISAWQSAGYPVWIATVHNVNTALNYDTIQAAIDAPQTLDGHTILVEAGTYYEHVVVNKAVSLIGENREDTIIDAGGIGNVVHVLANSTIISGFSIQSGGPTYFGIYFDHSSRNTLISNSITNSYGSIHLFHSSDNTLSSNNVRNNYDGISLYYAFNNSLSNNSVTNNFDYGIHLLDSSDNVVSSNNITNNYWYGIYLGSSSRNILFGNIVANNGEDGILLELSSNNNTISGNNITANEYFGIDIRGYSNHNSICGNIITNSSEGISLWSSLYNSISGNKIANNSAGFGLYNSSNNTISGNNIINSSSRAIQLYSNSNNNLFYHNNFINNTDQVYSENCVNVWDDGYPSGGNYWSDYAGVDVKSGPNQDQSSSDGIGDTAYVIDGNNQDNYPLMNPLTPTETIVKVQDKDYPVTIVSDTTIDQIGATANTLNFSSSGPTGEKGYILVIFPMVNTTEIEVFVDGVKLTPPPFPVINTNGTHYFIYFEFTLSIHNIAIQFAPLEYTLTIHSSPTGVTFTVDSITHTTSWSGTYSEGASVSLVMPETHDGYAWSHWLEEGDPNRIKTVTMNTNITLTGVFTPVPPPPPVGGKATPINIPMNKPELQTPWIWLTTIILSLVLTVVYVKKRKRRTEINS